MKQRYLNFVQKSAKKNYLEKLSLLACIKKN